MTTKRSGTGTRYVALLRAVNLGGHNKADMPALRELLTDLGLDDPRTVLRSGNVVFGADDRSAEELEQLLEAEAKRRLALDTEFFVRTAPEWGEIVASNPFPDEAKSDPSHLVVMVVKGAPDRQAVTALQEAITGRELAQAGGRHLYLVYPDGIGRSKLTAALIEKTLATRGTARNWNTVVKLADLVGPGLP